jgi:hypothetical protein
MERNENNQVKTTRENNSNSNKMRTLPKHETKLESAEKEFIKGVTII